MVAMIERNPRQGVELREQEDCLELFAAISCYWLVAMLAVAVATGDAVPLLVSLAIVFAGLYATRPRQ